MSHDSTQCHSNFFALSGHLDDPRALTASELCE